MIDQLIKCIRKWLEQDDLTAREQVKIHCTTAEDVITKLALIGDEA